MKNFLTISMVIVLSLWTEQVFAQYKLDSTFYQITTKDGTKFIGQIAERGNQWVEIHTEMLGTLSIPTEKIVSIQIIDPTSKRQGRPDYFQTSKYFLGGNAYGLQKGESYFQNSWIFFNNFSYGVTNYSQMGFGFLFAGSDTPIWLTPKFSIPIIEDKLNLGGGALVVFLNVHSRANTILYGTVTAGSRDYNLSLGSGAAIGDSNWQIEGLLAISGSARIGNKTFLMTENYLVKDGGSLFTVGGRSIVNRISIDYGLMMLGNTGSLIKIPWLGVIVPLHKE